MLLDTATDKIRLVTSAAGAISVVVEYADLVTGTPTPGSPAPISITTATTTDIVPVIAVGQRRVKHIVLFNDHATNPNTLTVIYTDGTTPAGVS